MINQNGNHQPSPVIASHRAVRGCRADRLPLARTTRHWKVGAGGRADPGPLDVIHVRADGGCAQCWVTGR